MCIDSYADISIHTPTRGTTAGTGTATNLAEFQSTFPREERPYYTIVRIQVLQFQSTLPREERLRPPSYLTPEQKFQSTLPREERRSGRQSACLVDCISIHAPTRGATVRRCSSISMSKSFQSTLPREERQQVGGEKKVDKKFQSTLPREERHSHKELSTAECNFNPRSHERSDLNLLACPILPEISIHAPTRGATLIMCATSN